MSGLKQQKISLKFKMALLIGCLVAFTIIVIVATFWVNRQQKDFALIINIAGRQRMLTQKMTKEVMSVARELETEDKSRKLVNQLIQTRNHLAKTIANVKNFELNKYTAGFIPARAGREISAGLTEGTAMKLKQTSLKIRNPENNPDPFEAKVLNMFENDGNLEEYSEKVEEDGIKYFRYMKRLVVIKACLKCHSRREDAPAYVRDNYPHDRAYGYKVGDVRGAISVKMPLYGAIYDAREALKGTTDLFDRTLKALRNGGITMGAGAESVYIPAAQNEEIIRELNEGQILWKKFMDNIRIMLRPGLSVESKEFRDALTFIEMNNVALLKKMNSVTEKYQKTADSAISFLEKVQIWALILTLFVAVVSVIVIGRIIITPLKIMSGSLNAVAMGDLTSEVRIKSKDEIGDMVNTVNDMTANLRNMMIEINKTSVDVKNVSDYIVSAAEDLSGGAEIQVDSIAQASTSIEEINASVARIAEHSSKVTASAEEASSSTIEIAASIDEVASTADELSQTVDEVSSSISAMAEYIREISSLTSHLSSRVMETASAVTQINASTREVESNARNSASLAKATAKDAEAGRMAVRETTEAMGGIKEGVDEAVNVIVKLGEKSENIGSILNVINEVADQTNLLALNASIIASQAGEHGRGFAVVADQIKNLANRTRSSTKDIEELITSVQNEVQNAVKTVKIGGESVNKGVDLARRAGKALDKILESVKSSTEMVEQIARASSEQLKGSQQVSEAMEKVTDMLDKVYKAVAEQERSSNYIAKVAQQMREASIRVKKATKEQSSGGALISKAIEEILEMVSSIEKATKEEAQVTGLAVKAVEDINEITEKNVENVRKMKGMSETLVSQAGILDSAVKKFKMQKN